MRVGTYSIATYCLIHTTGPIDESLGNLDEIVKYVYRRWDVSPKINYIDKEASMQERIEEREAGGRMLKDAQGGQIDLVVMRTYSRLSEDVEEFFRIYTMFDRLCVPIFFIHDPADLNILAHISRHKKFHEEGLRERELEQEKARTTTG